MFLFWVGVILAVYGEEVESSASKVERLLVNVEVSVRNIEQVMPKVARATLLEVL